MIRGMIKKRQERLADEEFQKHEAIRKERECWGRHFKQQIALAKYIEQSVISSPEQDGRANPLSQQDYRQAYQLYTDYVDKVMEQWISKERNLAGASVMGGSVVAGPLGLIATGAKATANLLYLRKFTKPISNFLADLKAVAEACPLVKLPETDDNTEGGFDPSIVAPPAMEPPPEGWPINENQPDPVLGRGTPAAAGTAAATGAVAGFVFGGPLGSVAGASVASYAASERKGGVSAAGAAAGFAFGGPLGSVAGASLASYAASERKGGASARVLNGGGPDVVRVALTPSSFNFLGESIFTQSEPHQTFQHKDSFLYTNIDFITRSLQGMVRCIDAFTGISAIEADRLAAMLIKDALQQIDLHKPGLSVGETSPQNSIEVCQKRKDDGFGGNDEAAVTTSFHLTKAVLHHTVQIRHACFMRSSELSFELHLSSWKFDSFENMKAYAMAVREPTNQTALVTHISSMGIS